MSLRSVLIVLMALVCGATATVLVGKAISQNGEKAPRPDSVAVVVTTADVPRFGTLTVDQLTTRDWPKDMVPAGAIMRMEDATDRVALIPLVKGEHLLEARLAPRGSGRGMGPGITVGRRAFTIQTPNVATGVAGFILPGSKVDVLLTVPNLGPNDKSGGMTITLLQNVEILAVDQRVDAPAENRVDTKELRSVTLSVTPDEAATLDYGQNKGALHLSLRNPEDKEHVTGRRVTLAEIGLEDKPREAPAATTPLPAPQPNPVVVPVRTLRGTSEGRVDFYSLNGTSGDR